MIQGCFLMMASCRQHLRATASKHEVDALDAVPAAAIVTPPTQKAFCVVRFEEADSSWWPSKCACLKNDGKFCTKQTFAQLCLQTSPTSKHDEIVRSSSSGRSRTGNKKMIAHDLNNRTRQSFCDRPPNSNFVF
jgi:hypothetical protein